MDLSGYRRIINRHAALAPILRHTAYQKAAQGLSGPLSAWERQISKALAARHTAEARTWYHGGLAGREVGDLILPPSKTGAVSWKTTDTWRQQNAGRVYVTHYAGGADYFARWNERLGREGRVYFVEPQGALTVDPEAFRLAMLLQEDRQMRERHLAHIGDFLSRFTCESAKVLEVGVSA